MDKYTGRSVSRSGWYCDVAHGGRLESKRLCHRASPFHTEHNISSTIDRRLPGNSLHGRLISAKTEYPFGLHWQLSCDCPFKMDNNQSATSTSTETTTNNQPLSDVGDIEQQTLSKKAQKKAAKQVRLAELKLERRAREKAAKKEKKRLKREAGEPIESDARKRARKEESGPPFMAKLVIDLGFDSLMTDKVRI